MKIIKYLLRIIPPILLLVWFSTLPVYLYENGHIDYGWAYLVVGWTMAFDSNFSWYAIILSLISFFAKKYRFLFNGSAFLLSMTIFSYIKNYPLDATNPSLIVDYKVGCYVWVLIFLINFLFDFLLKEKCSSQ